MDNLTVCRVLLVEDNLLVRKVHEKMLSDLGCEVSIAIDGKETLNLWKKDIDIIFMDEFGDPFGRVWHSKIGSTTLIRRRQLEIAYTIEGVNLALD